MRLYRWLTKAFPRAFRQQYGDELEAAAAQLMTSEASRGRLHRVRLWIGLWTDAITRGLAERRAERMPRRGLTVRMLATEWRQAVRALASRPGFAAMIVGLLAMTMGANTAVFGVVNATLLRSLPYADPERLVLLWESYAPMHLDTMPWSDLDYLSARSASSLAGTAIFQSRRAILTGAGEPASLRAVAVESSLFTLLGARPEQGRLLRAEDERVANGGVVVLSHACWQTRFGGDPAIVGQTIVLDTRPHIVVGVLAGAFSFPPPITFAGQMLSAEPDAYVPYAIDTAPASRGSHNAFALGRLRPGVTVGAAQSEVAAIAAGLERQFPDTNVGVHMAVLPLHGQSVVTIRTVLFVLLGSVGGVLLIACASISNLILARSSGRSREMALRAALGASRATLTRQLLFESAILGAAGTALGLLAAQWISSGLLALNPIELPGMFQSSFDWRVLAFSAAMTLAAVFAFGLVPALKGSRTDLLSVLRGGSRATDSASDRRMKAALVVVQVALALMLLVGSGLTIHSLMRLWQVDPGFRPAGITSVPMGLPRTRYPTDASQREFEERLLLRLRQIPGVTRTAAVTLLPFNFDRSASDYSVVGAPARKTGDYLLATYQRISSAYVGMLHLTIREGRDLTDGDVAGAPLVALVSESLARRHWPAGQAVGHQLLTGQGEGEIPKTVVGVVSDVITDSFDGRIEPTIYLPLPQAPVPAFWAIAASARSADTLAPEIRAAVHDVDPGLPVGRVRALSGVMSDTIKKPRFTAIILSVFAATALLIAAIGLYGVLAFDVAARRRELGVRVALGATPRGIRRLVLARGLSLVGLGLAVGGLGAYICARLMTGLLFQVPATDAAAFVTAGALLAVAALAAMWPPIRRATRADPIEALRAQ